MSLKHDIYIYVCLPKALLFATGIGDNKYFILLKGVEIFSQSIIHFKITTFCTLDYITNLNQRKKVIIII